MEYIFQVDPKAFVDGLDGSSDDGVKEIEESRKTLDFSPEHLGTVMTVTEVKIQEIIILMWQKLRPLLGRITIDKPFRCPSKNVSHVVGVSETQSKGIIF